MIDISLTGEAARNASPVSEPARAAFIERQKALIDGLYRGEQPQGLLPEEAMLADLIAHDRTPESGLHSFNRNFMAVIEFDAHRQGRLASRTELQAYTTCLATAVMDGLQYFIGNGQPYPLTHNRTLSVTGAHITHMLRDMCEDLSAGLVNIPVEYLEAHGIALNELNSEPLCLWTQEQVALVRDCFREGKNYIDSLDGLRSKLAGVWYCARFECILDLIEQDGFRLRAQYPERHGLKVWLEMARLGVSVILDHFAGRLQSFFLRLNPPAGLNSKWNIPFYHIK